MKWGTTGNATQLFSPKRGLGQNLLDSSKKAYHPKHVMSKLFKPI